ncbi:MAG: hypothetical protein HYX47_09375 [Burkholderiales bacterium]|nr:hypothetical protein [Burkholderiales bacterium]
MNKPLCILWLAVAMLGAACESPQSPLEAKDLERAARDTASLAAEGALLVRQAGQGSVSSHYVWVHQQALQEENRRVGESLQKPVPAFLQTRQQQAAAVNLRLAGAFGRLGFAVGDPRELGELSHTLAQVREQAKAAGDGR